METYVVLDTDVVSRTHKRTLPTSLVRQLDGLAPAVSFVTVGELEKWAAVYSWGRMAGEAVRRGRPRQPNDMWIAACCIVESLPLATLNVKDYEDFVTYHGLSLITA